MSTIARIENVSFMENDVGEASLREYVGRFARGCRYVAERIRFHWHLYSTDANLSERQIVAAFLRHLGYRADCVDDLTELTQEQVDEVIQELFQRDLARDEELLSVDDARLCAQRVSELTAPWAILAFTNMKISRDKRYRLGSYDSCRVVAHDNVEGGMIFIGEQDIAMVWFLDDDGPTRASYDYRDRRK